MRKIFLLSIALLLVGCNHIESIQMKKALDHFIRFEAPINEHDALSRELDWHEPRVIQKQKTRNLTGKDLISICNKYGSEPDSQMNPFFITIRTEAIFQNLKNSGLSILIKMSPWSSCLGYNVSRILIWIE